RAGIEQVEWPGRFQVVPGAPLIVIDGAHNGESAQRLREALRDELADPDVIIVLGVARDKDLRAVVAGLMPARLVIATAAGHPRAAAPNTLAELAAALGAETLIEPTVADALATARELARPEEVV